jgi:hypothetical protein
MKGHVGTFVVLSALVGCGAQAPEDEFAQSESALALPEQAASAAVEATAHLVCNGPPALYVEGSCKKLAPGVRRYEPVHALWSDGAEKERFIYLPPGTQIDTANPNRWTFPVGTRLYKTFTKDDKRIETRLIEKVAPATGIASWTFAAYAWSEDQRSAALAPAEGVQNALGTSHDIPSQAQCRSCHNPSPTVDVINGFGAIELNHPGDGVTLRTLLREELLVNSLGEPNVTLENATIPGDQVDTDALGYLGANCGNCHGGPTPRAGLALWATVGAAQVSDMPAFKTAVCKALSVWKDKVNPDGVPYALRVDPGHADTSGIVGRMTARGSRDQMPPIGTELVDWDGVGAVRSFIDRLPEDLCQTP